MALREIVVGCHVWHRLPEDPDFVDRRGGLVLAIGTALDEESGEVTRRFLTASRFHGRVKLDELREDEVNAETINPPSSQRMVHMSRLLAFEYAKGTKRLTPHDLRLIESAHVLARSV